MTELLFCCLRRTDREGCLGVGLRRTGGCEGLEWGCKSLNRLWGRGYAQRIKMTGLRRAAWVLVLVRAPAGSLAKLTHHHPQPSNDRHLPTSILLTIQLHGSGSAADFCRGWLSRCRETLPTDKIIFLYTQRTTYYVTDGQEIFMENISKYICN